MANNNPNPNPGVPRLFMPDRLFNTLQGNAYMPGDGPHVPGWHPLPLPTPHTINAVNHPGGNNLPNATLIGQTRCNELKAALIRTRDDSITHPAPFIDTLPANLRITRLWRHPDICPNLARYGDLDGQGVEWQPSHIATVNNSQANAATARDQALALDRLANWYINHITRSPDVMTSAKSLQDEILIQLVEPLNHHLASRYANTNQIANAATARDQALALDRLANWYINHITRSPDVMTSAKSLQDEILIQLVEPLNHHLASRYANTNQIVGHPANDADTTRYPLWIRPPPHRAAHHGGYPDFSLVAHPTAPAHQSHKAIIHVKTWWSYRNDLFRDIFEEETANAATGVYHWPGNDSHHKLIKQLWGSLVSQRCNWGMCMNGKLLFVFRRVGIVNPQFVQQLMAGLSFAAIDENNHTIARLSRYLWPAHRVDNNW
ncbi:hypothetical protein BU17DRAFT_71336 [Hysterangium stoloniferum]|nr:hypothetical protein BU17DRAFT_71336 [Hysterangium stoloniferum]